MDYVEIKDIREALEMKPFNITSTIMSWKVFMMHSYEAYCYITDGSPMSYDDYVWDTHPNLYENCGGFIP